MSTQVSSRLSFPQAEALLTMMDIDARPLLYQALDKPDTDIPAGNHRNIAIRYFRHDNAFTVTFR